MREGKVRGRVGKVRGGGEVEREGGGEVPYIT